MSAVEILSLLVNILSAIETLTPEIETVIGVAKKIIAGEPVTDADLASLQAVQATLDGEVSSAAAKVEG